MVCKLRCLFVSLTLAAVSGASAAEAAQAVKGYLVADIRGQMAAQITGERSQRVKDVLVRVGDRVKKDDVLARLDTEQLEADRLITQRALEEARAAVEVAKAAVARATLDFKRRAGLKGSPSYNRAAFEDAEIGLQAAQGQLLNAESNVQRREAEISRVSLEIALAEIKSPYDALVLDIITSVGASVTQQSPALLTLQDLSQIEIAVPVSDTQVNALTPGQTLDYTLSGGPKKTAILRAVVPGQADEGFVARLQVSPADLPMAFRDRQPVDVYINP